MRERVHRPAVGAVALAFAERGREGGRLGVILDHLEAIQRR